MSIVDARTAYLMTGFLYALMPLVVWLSLREQKTPAIVSWCVGGGLFGAALVLMSVREHVPDWLSYEVAALCIFSGNTLRVQALRQELQKPWRPVTLVLLIAGIWLVYVAARRLDVEGLYFYWSLLCLSILFLSLAVLARQIERKERLSTAWWLGAAYVPLALFLLLRIIQSTLGEAEPSVLANDYVPIFIALIGVVAAVLGNGSYLGMYVERATRQQLQRVREQAQREENARLASQIAQLDRQRSMGLISSSLAHELSQPLTSISIITECAKGVVQDQPQPLPTLAGYLDDLQRHTHNAIAIMDRIRNFIKARPVQHQRVSLQEVIDNVRHLMGDWLKAEHITLQIQVPEQALIAQGDPVQLAQILVNLLRSAGQATAGQSQRQIHITLQQEWQQALLQVQDNGPGFKPEQLQTPDSPFVSTKAEGMGVGLNISRHIATQHHGELTLANLPTGGAQVTLRLPVY